MKGQLLHKNNSKHLLFVQALSILNKKPINTHFQELLRVSYPQGKGNKTMNTKQVKMLRKLSAQNTKKTFRALEKEVKTKLAEMIKPAPKYFPKRLWYKIAGVFLNFD